MKKLIFILVCMLFFAFTGCEYFLPTDQSQDNGSAGLTEVSAKWFTGTTGPTQSQGVDGDLYMNTATGELFVKTSGAWALAGNVTGPAGETGSTGPGTTIEVYTYEITEDMVDPADGWCYWLPPITNEPFFDTDGTSSIDVQLSFVSIIDDEVVTTYRNYTQYWIFSDSGGGRAAMHSDGFYAWDGLWLGDVFYFYKSVDTE